MSRISGKALTCNVQKAATLFGADIRHFASDSKPKGTAGWRSMLQANKAIDRDTQARPRLLALRLPWPPVISTLGLTR